MSACVNSAGPCSMMFGVRVAWRDRSRRPARCERPASAAFVARFGCCWLFPLWRLRRCVLGSGGGGGGGSHPLRPRPHAAAIVDLWGCCGCRLGGCLRAVLAWCRLRLFMHGGVWPRAPAAAACVLRLLALLAVWSSATLAVNTTVAALASARSNGALSCARA